MDKLLIVDDNRGFLNDVESLLQDRFVIVKALTGRKGLEIARVENPTVVLLDLELPDMGGIEVLRALHRDVDPYLPVIIVTDHAETENAVESMRLGAYDFIPKSFNRDVLCAKVLKALERRTLEISVRALQSSFAEHHDRLVFASEPMKRVHYEIARLSALPFDVLITGETGVGKDLCAFEIHQRGPRREKPFIPLAMRSLSESLIESELFGHEKGAFSGADKTKIGKLEAAQGGTLYIPEISSLTEAVQLKLLQFMQYRSIARVGQDSRRPDTRLDVRVVMATNESLEEQVRKGRMREDFYHRITGVKLVIPPLRERKDDIEPLATYFLRKFASAASREAHELATDALEAMVTYRWPGNVRELENSIKGALAYSSGKVLTLADFPILRETSEAESFCRVCLGRRSEALPEYRVAEQQFKRAYAEELVHRHAGSIPKAAAAAGISAQGFRKVLKGRGRGGKKKDA
jgi:DNA-binding NtrC family response regulator